jgi:mono/diheme cytochrome c family protein
MAARIAAGIAAAITCALATAQSPDGKPFTPAQIRQGSQIYAQNCAPCHGARMLDGQAAFDLRQFQPEWKTRFVVSVTKGKNQMPPWGDLFKPEEIESLWAYVIAGEKK